MGAQFHATLLVAEVRDGTMTVGLAADPFDPQQAVLLQRDLVTHQQDTALGFDQVYIEFGDQVRSCYGGIAGVSLRDGRVEITLTEDGTRILGTHHICVTFQPGLPEFDQLQAHMVQLFEPTPGILVFSK